MNYRLSIYFFVAPFALLAAPNGPAVSSTGTPLTAWRAFFHHVQNLQTAAQTANPADAAQLASWLQKRIGLTDADAAQVTQVAATNVTAIGAIEKQASQILQAERANFPGGKLPSHGSLPSPSPQLAQLQQQRDTLTLAHIQSLQSGLSAGSFATLDAWIKSNFFQQIKKPGLSGVHPPAPGPQGGNQ